MAEYPLVTALTRRCGWVWRTQAWAAIWTASQGLPSGGV
jgi:hypothetical protein